MAFPSISIEELSESKNPEALIEITKELSKQK